MSVDTCIHIANLFYLGSYLCRDILWLRILTTAGLAFGIIFFCSQSQAMITPAAWMGVFLVVNLVQIMLVIRERRAIQLSPEQNEVGQVLHERLTRDEMLNILTKSLFDRDCRSDLIEQSARIQLDVDQQLVRNLAFNRLSDGELINLIIRRFWNSICRHPTSWFRYLSPNNKRTRRSTAPRETAPAT